MSENTQNNPTSNGASAPNSQPIVETNFLNGTETSKESLYADLFTKNENNEIVRKQNSKRSILEIVTIVLGIAMPIALTLAVLGGVHAFIKGQEDNSSIENFQFLCGYIRSGVNTDDPAYECQTPSYITKDVEEKTAKLKKDIVEQLSFYIPLKLSTSANTISKEKEKAEEIYGKKISVNEIIEQFNKIRRIAQSPGLENIICSSLSISDNNNLSVQCSVYG